ncbi:MAG: FmdB family zinc ribbon protein [Armatimonadota bacterium]
MPIYEFDCKQCGSRFDLLCRISGTDEVICPQCGSGSVKKVMSMFHSKSSSEGGGSCSCGSSCTCGSGGGCGGSGGCGKCH